MLLIFKKIRQIAYDLDACIKKNRINDYRIQLNGDLGINVFVSVDEKGIMDYSVYGPNDLIVFEEIYAKEVERDDYYHFIFEDKQKINFGYRERLRSLVDPDVDIDFGSGQSFPPIITFYSYKGGLGRTTTLSGFAIHCAHNLGMKVLIIDCDLEAPGVPNFYDIDADILHKTDGIVEYLINKRFDGNIDLNDYIIQPHKRYSGGKGDIFILPAGNLSDDYDNAHYKVDELDFDKKNRLEKFNIHRTHYLEGLSRLDISNPDAMLRDLTDLIQELNRSSDFSPDLILIDSRTGFNEILGVFVLAVSDIIVGFFRDELQARPGLHYLFERVNENKKYQQLLIVNAIISSPQGVKKFENDLKLLSETFDTGEGPFDFKFGSVYENSMLKNLGGDSEFADQAFIDLITQKQFHSYNDIFDTMQSCIQLSEDNRRVDANNFQKPSCKNSARSLYEKKIAILDELFPYCEKIFSDDFDFETTDKNFLIDRFYYRNVMLNIFNRDKFLILAIKGTGKTIFYKALQSEKAVENLKRLAKKSGDYIFVNVISKEKNSETFYPIDKFKYDDFRKNPIFFFDRFWVIYLWKAILLENDRVGRPFSNNSALDKYTKLMRPNDSRIASEFIYLIYDDELFGFLEQDLRDWDEALSENNRYLFVAYDFLDEIVKPDDWEKGHGIVPLFNFWRYNPYKRFLPKLFVRTDLFKKIVGITNYGNLERSRSFSLEWKKEELFALLFKQVLSKTKYDFFDLMKSNGIPADVIDEIKTLADGNQNQMPLERNFLSPMVKAFFGVDVGYHKRGGDTYNWFYNNLRNADNTISIRPFLNMLSLAIERSRGSTSDIRSRPEVLPYTYYANQTVRSRCVEAYFRDLANNSEGNKPLSVIFDFIRNENKMPGELRRHTLSKNKLDTLLDLVLRDPDSKTHLEDQTVEKLEKLLIDNGIIRKTYKRGGMVSYNFAYLYKFYLGLKSWR